MSGAVMMEKDSGKTRACPAEADDARLGEGLDPDRLSRLAEEAALAGVMAVADRLMAGQVRGRVAVPTEHGLGH